jgi:hypothetical protein
MKTLFKILVVLSVLYLCAVAATFFAGMIGAVAAAYFHASPYATRLIVRLFTTTFFFGFALLAWVIYSRTRARQRRLRNRMLNGKNDVPEPR